MTVDGWMDGWTLRSSYLTTLPGTRIPVESQSPTANPSERPSAPLNPYSPPFLPSLSVLVVLVNLDKWMLSSFPATDKPLSSCLTPSTMVSSVLPLTLYRCHNGPLDFARRLTTSWNSQRPQAPIETNRSVTGAKRPLAHRILGLLLVVT